MQNCRGWAFLDLNNASRRNYMAVHFSEERVFQTEGTAYTMTYL